MAAILIVGGGFGCQYQRMAGAACCCVSVSFTKKTMSKPKTRFSNLDAMRALAAFGVCFYHLNWEGDDAISWLFSFGYLGVNVFFAISGYITPLVLVWSKFTYPESGRFLLSRFFRLYPAFAFIALMVMLLHTFGSSLMGFGHHPEVVTWSRTLANFFLYAEFVGERWYVPVFWTLAIEAQFVFAILLFFPLLAHRKEWVRCAVVLVWALAPICVGRGNTLLSYSALYGMGMIVFLKLHKSLAWWKFLPLLGCAFYCHFRFVSQWAAWTALGTVLVIAYLPQLSQALSERLKVGYLGQLSYSFFLIHITIGGAVMGATRGLPSTWPYQFPGVLAATVASVFAAALFHHWIEHPLHVYSRTLKAKKTT